MERFRRIYHEVETLFSDVMRTHTDKFGYSMAFSSKMASFEIMSKETLKKARNLQIVAKEEKSENKIAMTRTTRALYEAVAFFEAYLNSFYSLLQIVARFTPLFYEENKVKIPDDYFGEQVNFFVKEHPELDPEFSSYLAERLAWYKTLKNNRHAATHTLSAFLVFEKDYTVAFIDYPDLRRKEFDWSGEKTSVGIENYLDQSFKDLFDFLEFYTQHFRKRVPESDRTKAILRSVLQENAER